MFVGVRRMNNGRTGPLYTAPMTTVKAKEVTSKLDDLLAEAAKGEEVVIVGEDGTIFKLVLSGTGEKKRGLVGSAKGQVWMADDFDEPLEDFKEYME